MKSTGMGLTCLALSCVVALASLGCGSSSTPEKKKSAISSIETEPAESGESATNTSSETTSTETVKPASTEATTKPAPETTSTASASTTGEPSDAGYGHLKGRFVFDGTPPVQAKVNVTKDIEYCTKNHPLDESLVVNADNKGLANVVVSLSLKRGAEPPKAHPSYDNAGDVKTELDNEFCRFEPHIIFVRTGQKLVIGNKDPVGHNTKGDLLSNSPFNETIPAGGSIEKTFDEEERVPVPVSCSIHPWMIGHLVVQQHPYVAITDKDGNFEIKNLPVGDWTFRAWQEKKGFVDEVTVKGKKETWSKGNFDVTIKEGTIDMGDIKVSPDLFK